MTFTMPRPGPEHAFLARMAGRFTGRETMCNPAWSPEMQEHTSTVTARVLDGFFVVTDYEQSSAGRVTFRGHGVYGWDPHASRYMMYWFDSMGGPGGVATGTVEGDVLTFENTSPLGRQRYRYTFGADGYTFEMALAPDGGDWTTLMTGDYRPAP
ncbi:MAG TPA: DUF1579 family protein [Candidatus Krumholzibacteria bacterium]|nr:DUF1579 family protein [Candidatus Krumholzibacteria bacterium]